MIPIHDVFAQLIFAAGRDDVSDVWVDGEQLIKDRKSTRIEFSNLKQDVAEKIAKLSTLEK